MNRDASVFQFFRDFAECIIAVCQNLTTSHGENASHRITKEVLSESFFLETTRRLDSQTQGIGDDRPVTLDLHSHLDDVVTRVRQVPAV